MSTERTIDYDAKEDWYINEDCLSGKKILYYKDTAIPLDKELLEALKGVEFTCPHERTEHKIERDCHPYGDDVSFDVCFDCGEKLNFKITSGL